MVSEQLSVIKPMLTKWSGGGDGGNNYSDCSPPQ